MSCMQDIDRSGIDDLQPDAVQMHRAASDAERGIQVKQPIVDFRIAKKLDRAVFDRSAARLHIPVRPHIDLDGTEIDVKFAFGVHAEKRSPIADVQREITVFVDIIIERFAVVREKAVFVRIADIHIGNGTHAVRFAMRQAFFPPCRRGFFIIRSVKIIPLVE